MNAAAKTIHQSDVFHGHWSDLRLSLSNALHLSLLMLVLFSALSVVYIINLHRTTLSEYEYLEHQSHQLQRQRGQLLLEQASLATPSRVEQVAQDKLNMHLPGNNKTKLLLRAQ